MSPAGPAEGTPVTFSILLRDGDTGEIGGGVASRFLAVGAMVLHARAGHGAVATQALVNVALGPRGLSLLELGVQALGQARMCPQSKPKPPRASTDPDRCDCRGLFPGRGLCGRRTKIGAQLGIV